MKRIQWEADKTCCRKKRKKKSPLPLFTTVLYTLYTEYYLLCYQHRQSQKFSTDLALQPPPDSA